MKFIFCRALNSLAIFLPLINLYDFQHNFLDWRYDDRILLSIAFYIFDKNQIYYAKSANLSKRTFLKNTINPKDTHFIQSEWDYLVYEALLPLLERGVELEISTSKIH